MLSGRSGGNRRLTLQLAVVGALLVSGLACARTTALADSALQVSPNQGAPASNFEIKGSGFPANSQVILGWDPTQVDLVVFGDVRTDDNGSFTSTQKVPRNAQPGPHIVAASSFFGGPLTQANFIVTPGSAAAPGGQATPGASGSSSSPAASSGAAESPSATPSPGATGAATKSDEPTSTLAVAGVAGVLLAAATGLLAQAVGRRRRSEP